MAMSTSSGRNDPPASSSAPISRANAAALDFRTTRADTRAPDSQSVSQAPGTTSRGDDHRGGSNSSSSSSRRINRRRRSSAASSSVSSRNGGVHSPVGDPSLPWEYIYTKPDGEISAWLKCAICLNVFVDPYVAEPCQHTFCKTCIFKTFASRAREVEIQDSPTFDLVFPQDEDFEQSRADTNEASSIELRPPAVSAPCPNCRKLLHPIDVIPATALVRQIVDSLEVCCPNQERGCPYTCERHLVLGHLEKDCVYAYVSGHDDWQQQQQGAGPVSAIAGKRNSGCPACGAKVMRKDWEEHVERSGACSVSWSRCRWCDVRLRSEEVEQHQGEECESAPVKCHFCGRVDVLRRDMQEHSESTCEEATVVCPRQKFGCSWIGKRRQCKGGELFELEEEDRIEGVDDAEHVCPLAPLDPFWKVYSEDVGNLREENDILRARLDATEVEVKDATAALDRCMKGLGPFLPEISQADQDGNRSRWMSRARRRSSQASLASALDPGDHEHTAALSSSNALPNRANRSVSVTERGAMPAAPIRSPSLPLSRSMPDHLGSDPAQSLRDSLSTSADAGRIRPRREPAVEAPSAPALAVTSGGLNLTTELASLRSTLDDLSLRLRISETRTDEGHMAAISASFDAGRTREEMQSLRHVVGAIRMQMHQLLMQMQRPYPVSGGFGVPGGSAAPGAGDPSNPTPNQVTNAGLSPSLPVSIAPSPPFLRRWTAFEGTKL